MGMGRASLETPNNKKLLEMHKIELFQSFSCTLAVRYKNVQCDYPMYESKGHLNYLLSGFPAFLMTDRLTQLIA